MINIKKDLLDKYYEIIYLFAYRYIIIDCLECYSNYWDYVSPELELPLKLPLNKISQWQSGYQPKEGAFCRIVHKYSDNHILIEEEESKHVVLVTSLAFKRRKGYFYD